MRRYVTRKKVAAGEGSSREAWQEETKVVVRPQRDSYSLFRVQLMGRCGEATAKCVFLEPTGAFRVVVGGRGRGPWEVG